MLHVYYCHFFTNAATLEMAFLILVQRRYVVSSLEIYQEDIIDLLGQSEGKHELHLVDPCSNEIMITKSEHP